MCGIDILKLLDGLVKLNIGFGLSVFNIILSNFVVIIIL